MKGYYWKKLGHVFDPSHHLTPSWMKVFAQAPSVVILDSCVRVYFSCRPVPDGNGQYVSLTGFVELNRRNLFEVLSISPEPIMSLGELGMFDEFGIYPISIVQHQGIFLAYYGGWTRCKSVPFNVAIGMATSDDGITFTKIGPGPILTYDPDEPFILSGPKVRKFNDKLYLFYISGRQWIRDGDKPEPIYKIRMAESSDGIQWTKLGRDLVPSRLNELEAQASPDVTLFNDSYHMYFSYRYGTNFRCKERSYRIGYASSKNLYDWCRDDANVGVDVSTTGWDSQSISYPHVFELDSEFYMFYLGNEVGKNGFGLAKLTKVSEL